MATERLRPVEDRAWRGFLLTHDRIWRELQDGLARLDISMGEYSVLALLAEAGAEGMRMTDLAERRLMSTGGFTRLADRLERRGLIERRRSSVDGRGLDVTLTGAGRALFRKAWRQHLADLRRLFFDHLDDDDLSGLIATWDRLASDER